MNLARSGSAEPSAALLAENEKSSSPQDKLDQLREACRAGRDDILELEDLEGQVAAVKARIQVRIRETIPELLVLAKVPAITLEAEGNHPAYEIKLKDFYRAGISAEWEPEKQQAAFDALADLDSGDLIKTTVTLRFGRDDREKALLVVALLRDQQGLAVGENFEIKQAVHQATLTKWLRERLQHKPPLPVPPLDVIGGDVGRVAEIKPVKPKFNKGDA
jgi:hypothetical protein